MGRMRIAQLANFVGPTSGGIKFNRMGLIIKSLVATVKETLAPDSARVVVSYNHLGRRIPQRAIHIKYNTLFHTCPFLILTILIDRIHPCPSKKVRVGFQMCVIIEPFQ